MALLLSGAAAPLRAQDPLTFEVGVELVQIEVRVTAGGEPVVDLEVDDFVLEEDGREQVIEAFDFIGPHADWAPTENPEPVVGARAAPPDENLPAHNWLYVLPEVRGSVELGRIAQALRRFIRDELPDGFLVSLAGLPFTDDRELLLESLDRMLEEPSDAIDPVLELQEDLIFQRAIAAALQRQNGILTSFVGMSRDPYFTGRADDLSRLVSVDRIDRQIIFFGQLALLRYLDLIERMAVLPGKKMILLYRSGLQVELQHGDLMEAIATAALRRRVSFFAVDSAGLRANTPADLEDRGVVFDWDSRRRRSQPHTISRHMVEVEPKQGLVTLASTTGGQALINTNDMGSILDDVLAESSNYYLLGYHPHDLRTEGRFRRVEVSVKRRGVKVHAPRGYFEAKPFEEQTERQRSVGLYRALLSGTPSDLDVDSDLSFFAAPGGRTATILSTGASPRQLDPKRREKGELKATVLLRIRNQLLDSMPLYFEQALRQSWDEESRDGAGGGAPPRVAYSARIDLAPGPYSLRVLFRDDESGEMGFLERSFEVPSLSGRSVPSSLLLTRLVQPAQDPGGDPGSGDDAGPPNDILDVGGLRPTPEMGRSFRQGDVVHGIYHLYGPTEDDVSAAGRGMQMALLRDGEWLQPGEVVAGGQAFPDEANDKIGFVSWLDTRGLKPGRYTVLAILPNYEKRQVPHLAEEFELLAR